ncbi:MAG: hypothetical protein AB1331_05760 [Bacillota bacterium]
MHHSEVRDVYKALKTEGYSCDWSDTTVISDADINAQLGISLEVVSVPVTVTNGEGEKERAGLLSVVLRNGDAVQIMLATVGENPALRRAIELVGERYIPLPVTFRTQDAWQIIAEECFFQGFNYVAVVHLGIPGWFVFATYLVVRIWEYYDGSQIEETYYYDEGPLWFEDRNGTIVYL